MEQRLAANGRAIKTLAPAELEEAWQETKRLMAES
jgi:hypothetical protein